MIIHHLILFAAQVGNGSGRREQKCADLHQRTRHGWRQNGRVLRLAGLCDQAARESGIAVWLGGMEQLIRRARQAGEKAMQSYNEGNVQPAWTYTSAEEVKQ